VKGKFGVKTMKILEMPELELKGLGRGQFKTLIDGEDVIIEANGKTIAAVVEAVLGSDFLMTPGQVQEFLGINYGKLTGLLKAGDLIAFGSGQKNMFKLRHVIKFALGETVLTEEEKAELYTDSEELPEGEGDESSPE
jgi:hypothetical protein